MQLVKINIPESYEERDKTIIELRTKLELRTWFLRASLAFNIAFLTGFLVKVAN